MSGIAFLSFVIGIGLFITGAGWPALIFLGLAVVIGE